MNASGSNSPGSPGSNDELLQELRGLTVAPGAKKPKSIPTEHNLTTKERHVVNQIQAEQYDRIANMDEKEIQQVTKFVANHSPRLELVRDLCDTSAKKYRKSGPNQKLLLERIAQMENATHRLRQEVPKRHAMLKQIDTNVATKVKPDDIASMVQNTSDSLSSLRDYQHQQLEEKAKILKKTVEQGTEYILQQEKETQSMESSSPLNLQSTEELKNTLKNIKESWDKLLEIMVNNGVMSKHHCHLLDCLFTATPGLLPAGLTDALQDEIDLLGILMSLNIIRIHTTTKKTKIYLYSHE